MDVEMDVEFKEFAKIARLNREVIVTEKIDGTNGVIYVTDNQGGVIAGSRSRWLTVDDDNFGFARWVHENAQELSTLGPGYHYGEWWGAGIQRRYGLQEKRFSLFNVSRWGHDGAQPRPACCHVVPVVWRGPFNQFSPQESISMLRVHGSYAAPGFMNPEGIVVFHTASGQLLKMTCDKDDAKSAAR